MKRPAALPLGRFPGGESLRAGLLLLALAAQCLWSMRQQTVTIDEYRHLPTGLYYLRTGDFSWDSKTPPLFKMACALPAYLMNANLDLAPHWRRKAGDWEPWIFATRFMIDNRSRYDDMYFWGQCVTLLAALALGSLIFLWARALYGGGPALFALLLFSFSPTLIANARMVTTDVGAALFMASTVYFLWRFLHRPSWTGIVPIGAALSLGILTKFTALILLPLVPLAIILRGADLPTDWAFIGPMLSARVLSPRKRLWFSALLTSGVVFLLVLTAINIQYGFRNFGRPLGSCNLQSHAGKRLKNSSLTILPLPFPTQFLEGLDAQQYDVETGEFASFLNGQWSRKGWWYYFLAAFSLKEPIPFLCLLVGLPLVPRKTIGRGFQGWEATCFWFVPAVLLVLLSFFNHLDVGIRYFLPAYPFLWISCARLAASGLMEKLWYRCGVIALGAWSLIVPFTVAPHYMAYFNELAGGPSEGYKHLLDSNLDHGQDLKYLKDYMVSNGIKKVQLAYLGHVWPQMYDIDFEPLGQTPKPGTVAISASYLQGQAYLMTYLPPRPIFIESGFYQAMKKYTPRAQVGHSIFLYDIPAEGK